MGGTALRPFSQPAPRQLTRNMAAGYAPPAKPIPLSIRMDGLFTQCCIAAVIYFVPQDIVFLAGLIMFWHSTASTVSPCKKYSDVDAAIEEFKAKKGLEKVH